MNNNSDVLSAVALAYSMAAVGNEGGSEPGMTPYQYALSIGYVGTKEQFDADYLRALTPVTLIDGGDMGSFINGGNEGKGSSTPSLFNIFKGKK